MISVLNTKSNLLNVQPWCLHNPFLLQSATGIAQRPLLLSPGTQHTKCSPMGKASKMIQEYIEKKCCLKRHFF